MAVSTIRKALIAIAIASAVSLSACGGDGPTSPTQPGPTVSDIGAAVTVSGVVSNFSRSGPGDINVSFRINDTTIVQGDGNTIVREGSMDSNTTSLRLGQSVTVMGVQRAGFVYAQHIVIDSR